MTASTRTGGRAATQGVIPGRFALSVGKPPTPEPAGFAWTALTSVARLESGHTPSRSRSDYWDGSIPWIGIRDATGNHGKVLTDTEQHVTELGLENSSARLLPPGTVCLSRTASVGYVVTMGVPMATSQDFVNWVCGPDLSSRYLHYVLVGEQESVRRFAHGTTHQTMYYPEAKALHALLPERSMQDAIAEVLGGLDGKIAANTDLISTAGSLAVSIAETFDGMTPLAEVVTHHKRMVSPESLANCLVEHYSLPAFDASNAPEQVAASMIKSGKFSVDQPCVLVSKLNPRFPRIWDVPAVGPTTALASTEFLVLESLYSASSVLWTVLSQPGFSASLESQVGGTSGSHQRVKPADLIATEVIDPRLMSDSAKDAITSLGQNIASCRQESLKLGELRDALLPELLSGRLRVTNVERIVEGEI
jgi:type I restriction enzyme, S subunit